MSEYITVKLTRSQAELVRQNADGWLDAGATEDGLTENERDALWALIDGIRKAEDKISKRK